MGMILSSWTWLVGQLELWGSFLPQLGLRLLLAYEFWDSGIRKLHGENWFAEIQDKFPFPFNHIPTDISWAMATWFELVGPILLVLGLGTRFFSLSLMMLTIVAWASVHADAGYNVCDGGWQLPLMYLVMFTPLLLNGGGKFSIDHLLHHQLHQWSRKQGVNE